MAALTLGIVSVALLKVGGPVAVTAGVGVAIVGATAGAYLDQQYIYPAIFGRQEQEQPRLQDVPTSTAREGAPIPRFVGPRNRIGAQIAWVSDPRIVEFGGSGGKRREPTTRSWVCDAMWAITDGPIPEAGVRKIIVDSEVQYDEAVFEQFEITLGREANYVINSVTELGSLGRLEFRNIPDGFGTGTVLGLQIIPPLHFTLSENGAANTILGSLPEGAQVRVIAITGDRIGYSMVRAPLQSGFFAGELGVVRYDNGRPIDQGFVRGSWRVKQNPRDVTTNVDAQVAFILDDFAQKVRYETPLPPQNSGPTTQQVVDAIQADHIFQDDNGDPVPVLPGTRLLFVVESIVTSKWNPEVLDTNASRADIRGEFEFRLGSPDQDVSGILLQSASARPDNLQSSYPGISYMAVRNLQIATFGNRIPSVSFIAGDNQGRSSAAVAIRAVTGETSVADRVETRALYGQDPIGSAFFRQTSPGEFVAALDSSGVVPASGDIIRFGSANMAFVDGVEPILDGGFTVSISQVSHLTIAPNTYDIFRDPKEIRGLQWAGRVEPAQTLAPLMVAFDLDARETGGTIEFIRGDERDRIVVPAEDLDCRLESDEPGSLLERTASTNRPRGYVVTYLSSDNDGQAGEESDILPLPRELATADSDSLSLSGLTIPDSTAHGIARDMTRRVWEALAEGSVRLPPKYGFVQEGDELEVLHPEGTVVLRVEDLGVGADDRVNASGTIVALDRQFYGVPPVENSRDFYGVGRARATGRGRLRGVR